MQYNILICSQYEKSVIPKYIGISMISYVFSESTVTIGTHRLILVMSQSQIMFVDCDHFTLSSGA